MIAIAGSRSRALQDVLCIMLASCSSGGVRGRSILPKGRLTGEKVVKEWAVGVT